MTAGGRASQMPLSALLSQLLVAFTVELDNEFERRMGEAGYPEARLSLVVWANLMRFLGGEPVAVRDLAAQVFCPVVRPKVQLGCLEWWRFVTIDAQDAPDDLVSSLPERQTRARRDGWGSGRGIRADSSVSLTALGQSAVEIWGPLVGEIEQRWRQRFSSDAIRRLYDSLRAVVGQFEVELPHGLPAAILVPEEYDYPPRASPSTEGLSLPALLSQTLFAFANEFDREAGVSLALCANAIRVLSHIPVPEAEIPRLTGSSPETSGVGWQLEPYVVALPERGRGKLVHLSPHGAGAKGRYFFYTKLIEERWRDRFGKRHVMNLRKVIKKILETRIHDDHLLISDGLVPPDGVARAGGLPPALGRRHVGAAARKRARDLVAQSEAFVRDPLGSLPHFPLWDMNRGFGP